MSKKNWDNRKKIISIPQKLGSVRIASETDVLFPCAMFEVALPVMQESELNIFEETVLKLINLGTVDPKKICEKTTMEKELIAFILNRLRQMEYIDKRNTLTSKGDNFFKQESEPKEIARVKIFRELINGNILPEIYLNDVPLTLSVAANKEEGKVEFKRGKTGTSKTVWAYILNDETPDYRTRKIDVHDVLRTVNAYNKSTSRVSILRGEKSSFVPVGDLISINNSPDLIYLHCKAIIQETNNECFVSAGIGAGYSSILKNCLEQKRPSIIEELKSRAILNPIQLEKQQNQAFAILGFGNNVYQYPEMSGALSTGEKIWNDICKATDRSENERKGLVDNINQFTSQMYALLEWTLRYIIDDTHRAEIPSYLFQQNAGEFLQSCAEKIGFSIPHDYLALLNVSAGAIEACENRRESVMEALLAIAIYDASQNWGHPLHNIIRGELSAEFDSGRTEEKYQESEWQTKPFLNFIAALKRSRDAVDHGDKATVGKEDVTSIRETTYRFIKELMPSLCGEKVTVQTAATPLDNIHQIYLKAQVALESYFGYNEFRSFDKNCRDLLENIEKNISNETDNALVGRVVIDLASLIQRTLFLQYKSGLTKLVTGKENFRETARTKAIAAGFELPEGQFGKSITTVKERFIADAVKGANKSIGANLISFLVNIDENTLRQIADKLPNLITLVENVAATRGHGNKITVNREEIMRLKKSVYETVKTLQEL